MLHLLDGAVQEHKDILLKIEEEKKPGTRQELTPRPLCYDAPLYHCAITAAHGMK